VLDIASGYGEWAQAAAQAAAQIQFVGIESAAPQVEQACKQAEASRLRNLTFMNADPFGHLEFPENSFDLVNARYLIGLLPASAWPDMVKECVRVTRPGGIVRLTETDMPITNSAAVEQISAWISQAYAKKHLSFSPTGRLLSITPELKAFLQKAGCQQVRQVVWNTNFSIGMPAYTQVSQDLQRTYRLLLPFLVSSGEAKQEEAEQAYQQMLSAMQSQEFTGNALSLTVWGIKG
jgi:ubiquinone/menaquinone biosynthesis C-methylase UbiE